MVVIVHYKKQLLTNYSLIPYPDASIQRIILLEQSSTRCFNYMSKNVYLQISEECSILVLLILSNKWRIQIFHGGIFVHSGALGPPPTNHNPINQFPHLMNLTYHEMLYLVIIASDTPSFGCHIRRDYIYILVCIYFRYYVYRKPGVFWPMIWQAGEWGYSWKYFAEILQLNHCFLSRTTALMNYTMMSSSEVTRQGK